MTNEMRLGSRSANQVVGEPMARDSRVARAVPCGTEKSFRKLRMSPTVVL